MSAVMTSQELKGYESQLARARIDLSLAQKEASEIQRKVQSTQAQVAGIEKKIRELQESSIEPIVSEHAILRWLERVDGIDMDKVRERVLDGGTSASIKFANTGRLMKNGHTLIFKNNTVVTVE